MRVLSTLWDFDSTDLSIQSLLLSSLSFFHIRSSSMGKRLPFNKLSILQKKAIHITTLADGNKHTNPMCYTKDAKFHNLDTCLFQHA